MHHSIFTLSLVALGASMTLAGPSHPHSLHRRHHARRLALPAGQPINSPGRLSLREKLEQQANRRVQRSNDDVTTTEDAEEEEEGDCEDIEEPAGTGNSTESAGSTGSNSTCTTDGAWMCSGQTLQRCDHSTWVTIATCSVEDLVCSAVSGKVGCLWSDSTSNSTGTGGPIDEEDEADDEDCDDDEPTSSTLLSGSGSASASVSAFATITAAPAQSQIGNGLLANGPASSDSWSEDSGSSSANWWDDNSDSSSSSADWNDDSETVSSSSPDWYNADGNSKSKGKHHKTSSADWTASSTDDWSPSSTTDWSPSSTADWSSPSQSDSSESDNNNQWNKPSSTRHGHGQASSTWSGSGASPTKHYGTNGTSGGGSGGSSGSFTAPHYVIYADNWLDKMPSADDIGNYNRFILAFWMSNSGAVDNAQAWEQFDDSYRQQVIEEYHAAGIALMVSAFGSTDSPTTSGVDAAGCATDLANWVKQYGLDGVDIDYEDMTAMNGNYAEDWLITFQQTLRQQLGSGYLISHAPVAPWFTSSDAYASGAYVKIHQEVGNSIDFYNVQFYNQGDIYVDCDTLINNSGNDWPSTSVMEINSYAGVPLDKIVIGKPNDAGAADNGYMDPSDLATCVAQAQSQGWNGGVMFWEWAGNHQSLLANLVALV